MTHTLTTTRRATTALLKRIIETECAVLLPDVLAERNITIEGHVEDRLKRDVTRVVLQRLQGTTPQTKAQLHSLCFGVAKDRIDREILKEARMRVLTMPHTVEAFHHPIMRACTRWLGQASLRLGKLFLNISSTLLTGRRHMTRPQLAMALAPQSLADALQVSRL